MEALFGVLRSHLSAQHRDVYWRAALWALLQEAYAQDAARYQEQWVPYLSAQTSWQEAPLARFFDVKKYRAACKVAPFATFFLGFSEYKDLDDLREVYREYGEGMMPYHIPTEFVALEQVHELWFNVGSDERLEFEHWGSCMWPEYLMSCAHDAKLKQLKVLSIGEECSLEGWNRNVLERIEVSSFPLVEVFELYTRDSVSVLDSLSTDFVERLKVLHIDDCGGLGEGELARLLARADLSRLEALTLRGAGVTPADLSALCQAPSFKALRKLSLSYNELSSDALELLTRASFIERLEDLDISGVELEEGLAAFLMAEVMSPLESLRVTSLTQWDLRQEDDPHERVLIERDPSWRVLTLRTEQSDAESWRALLCDEAVSFQLKALSLIDNDVSLEALDALLSAPCCAALEHLELWLPEDPSQHEALVRRLAQHPRHFKSLGLGSVKPLSFEAMQVLIEAEAFAQLEALSVELEREHLLDFLRSFRQLRRLDLSYSRIDSEVAQFLADECHRLEWLAANLDGVASAIIGGVSRLQDALRAAVSGRSCHYPWMKSR